MSLLFTDPGTATVFSVEVDEDEVHPTGAAETVIWSGTGVKLWTASSEKAARAQELLNITYSHQMSGVPQSVAMETGMFVRFEDTVFRVTKPEKTRVGFFDMGWRLYLKES